MNTREMEKLFRTLSAGIVCLAFPLSSMAQGAACSYFQTQVIELSKRIAYSKRSDSRNENLEIQRMLVNDSEVSATNEYTYHNMYVSPPRQLHNEGEASQSRYVTALIKQRKAIKRENPECF